MKIQKSLKVVLRIFAVVAMTWMLAAIPARTQDKQLPCGHAVKIELESNPEWKEAQLFEWLVSVWLVFHTNLIGF